MSQATNGIVKARPSAYNLIDPRVIVRTKGFNPRFEFGEIEELAKSIKHQATSCGVAGGLLNPVRVKRDGTGSGFILIDGDRRLTAIEHLIGLAAKGSPDGYDFPEGIPAYVVSKDQGEITSLLQMFEANTGKPFMPLEEAAAFKRMRDAGMTIEEISKAVQRAHVHVVATLALLDADSSVQEAVRRGAVGGTMAKKIAVAARGNKAKQAELVKEAVAAGNDKKAKRRVVAKIEEARIEKAAKHGRTIKMKALTDDQLAEMGAKAAKILEVKIREAGWTSSEDFNAYVEKCASDDGLATAYTVGLIAGLRLAAGLAGKMDL